MTFEENIRPVVEKTMETSQVPGIVVAVARGGETPRYFSVGVDAKGQPVNQASLFPVASVTKLATALAVLRLVDARRVGLDDELKQYLPEATAARPGVTIRRLLCHTSGMPADLDPSAAPYRTGLDWPGLARACLATAPDMEPEERVEYSNAGYGLLALVVERATGAGFRGALRSLVLEPLGVEGYLGDEPPRAPMALAGVRGKHSGTEIEPYNSAFWRSLALPWAGLVTNAEGALALVQAFAGSPAGFLQTATRIEALRNQVGTLSCNLYGLIPWEHCHWGLGVELRDAKSPHWAPATASAESYGHAGQSGCVVWRDPAADVAWAMLGTRTADSGWLLRHGSAIGAAILQATR